MLIWQLEVVMKAVEDKLSKIGYVLFYVYVSLLVVDSGLSYGKLKAFHIVGVFLLPYCVYNIRAIVKRIFTNSFGLILVLSFFYYVTSYIWVDDRNLWFKYIFYLLNGIYTIILFLLFIKDNKSLKRVITVFLVSVGVEVCLGVLETVTHKHWFISRYSSWLSYFNIDKQYDFYLNKLLSIKDSRRDAYNFLMSQPYGFHWGPNRFGLILTLTFPLFYSLNTKNKMLQLVSLAVVTYLVFMIASRSLIVAFSLSVICLFVISYVRERKFDVLLITPLVLFAALFYFESNIERRNKISDVLKLLNINISKIEKVSEVKCIKEADNNNKDSCFYIYNKMVSSKSEDTSLGKRQIMLLKGIDLLKNNLVLGTGAGNSAVESGMLFGKAQLHFFWFELLIELGPILFSIFLIFFIVSFLKLGLRVLTLKINYYLYLYIGSLVSLVSCSFSFFAIATPVYVMVMWVMIGLVVVLESLTLLQANARESFFK